MRGDCRAGTRCGAGGVCIAGCESARIPANWIRSRWGGGQEWELLFVIDDSGSMSEEQASLVAELPRLLNALLSGGDPATGIAFLPVRSLRVGVITTDMGTGPIGACGRMFGDDGVLLTEGNTADPSCMALYPSWLDFAADTGQDPSDFAHDVSCVASAVGTGGCGFEQQLDATLKALTPSTSGLTFAESTVGHGDGQNAGFLRESSGLAIITLTDEDDCSSTDTELFVEGSPHFDPNLNLRCFQYPEVLHPLSRYVDGLLALRNGPLVYAPITGIPVDLQPDPTRPQAPQIDALLEDERMIERVDPMDGTQLVASCDTPGRGKAFPPRRIARLTAMLEEQGAEVALGSICQESLAGPIDALLRAIAQADPSPCIQLPLQRNTEGLVACELTEFLAVDSEVTCEAIPGRVDAGVGPEGRRRCSVQQLPAWGEAPAGSGWYYDVFSRRARACADGPQRVGFTPGAELRPGSDLFLDCSQSEPPAAGSYCASRPERCAEAAATPAFPGGLVCSETRGRCVPVCESDADCGHGYRCSDDGICFDPACDWG